MSLSPLVSVVLPVYNGEKFLRFAIESVLNQTYRKFELIIVDDGSTDKSFKIAEEFSELDSRIRVFSFENRGIVESLNFAINEASGDYICRMDSDDICPPDRLLIQLRHMANNKEADVIGGTVLSIDHDGQLLGGWVPSVLPQEVEARLLFESAIYHPTVFAKKEVLKRNPYVKGFEGAEDYELWTRLTRLGYILENVNKLVLMYRVHDSQVSQQKIKEQKGLIKKIHSINLNRLKIRPSNDEQELHFSFHPKSVKMSNRYLFAAFRWLNYIESQNRKLKVYDENVLTGVILRKIYDNLSRQRGKRFSGFLGTIIYEAFYHKKLTSSISLFKCKLKAIFSK